MVRKWFPIAIQITLVSSYAKLKDTIRVGACNENRNSVFGIKPTHNLTIDKPTR